MLGQFQRRFLRSSGSLLHEQQIWFRRHENCGRLRGYTTTNPAPTAEDSAKKEPSDEGSDSIFSSKSSVWDHVFNDIKEMPPLLPSSARNNLRTQAAGDNTRRRTRRQTMTAREINAFDEMFNMIFNAVSEQKSQRDPVAGGEEEPGIGRDVTAVGDLFGKLRRHSKRVKWTSEFDELLDRKKEAMNLCDTDQQLLEWATVEVFGESQQYEAAWRKSPELPMQSPTYPHLVALLMREFRDKYHDPNLALAMFNYARNLSIASYVFGCSTQAYNELIETRWSCFRDLKGVQNALEEMVVNGVEFDSRTRKLVDIVRREIAGQHSWTEANELGGGEVWNVLTKIENLVKSGTRSDLGSGRVKLDEWKMGADEDDKGWEFGSWGRDPKPDAFEQRQDI